MVRREPFRVLYEAALIENNARVVGHPAVVVIRSAFDVVALTADIGYVCPVIGHATSVVDNQLLRIQSHSLDRMPVRAAEAPNKAQMGRTLHAAGEVSGGRSAEGKRTLSDLSVA